MLRIRKGTAPPCVDELRRTPGATWGSVHGDQKAQMRTFLVAEQGGLCAYCMRRISDEPRGCTVEHWRARSDEGTDPFQWRDLLAVCDGGGPGTSRDAQHCDRRRGNAPLRLHPAHRTRNVEKQASYFGDGRIRLEPDDDVATLNLNAAPLRRGRAAVIEAVLRQAMTSDATALRRYLARWEGCDADGQRGEYAGVALFLLRKRLSAVEAKARRTRKTRER